jgi:hypothetical protein
MNMASVPQSTTTPTAQATSCASALMIGCVAATALQPPGVIPT